MSLYKKISVLGGDMRQAAVAACLAEHGLTVGVWGLPSDILSPALTLLESWQQAVTDADVVVLPLPASPDSKHLNLPLLGDEGQQPPLLCDIVGRLTQRTLLAGGKFSPAVKEMIDRAGLRFFDYFESDVLQEKNAIPTAEGAIEVLMREVPRTVAGLCVAVTGFGRVARALVRLLLAMGARVTVAARRPDALAEAAKMGCDTVLLGRSGALFSLSNGYQVIFNTVPYLLFDETVLASLSPDTRIIDLASAPGGVDANAAGAHGIRVIWALSLPGKYAPITAGEIIAETVLTHMREEGML